MLRLVRLMIYIVVVVGLGMVEIDSVRLVMVLLFVVVFMGMWVVMVFFEKVVRLKL